MYLVFFLIPKRNGDIRAILDLKWLNLFLKKRKFKMETWMSVVASFQEGDYLTSVDLTEAYIHILIWPKHQQYLRFCYRSMPFGLTAAQQVFLKLLVMLVAHLHLQGVALHPYLDNIFICSPSRMKATEDFSLTLSCLQSLGFVVNETKSSFTPTQILEHLGLLINTEPYKVSPFSRQTNIHSPDYIDDAEQSQDGNVSGKGSRDDGSKGSRLSKGMPMSLPTRRILAKDVSLPGWGVNLELVTQGKWSQSPPRASTGWSSGQSDWTCCISNRS